MNLVYESIGQGISFRNSDVNELVIENKKLFFKVVRDLFYQSDGLSGGFVLSIADKPVEFNKYTDLSMQFTPFLMNRKTLLTKMYSLLEQNAVLPQNYEKTNEILAETERYIHLLSEDIPLDLVCKKLSISAIIRAVTPEIEESDKDELGKIFAYMELVREVDKDRLFIMVNMRTFFSDTEIERFVKTVSLHDFKVLLVENVSFNRIKGVSRLTVDDDLCEF